MQPELAFSHTLSLSSLFQQRLIWKRKSRFFRASIGQYVYVPVQQLLLC
jgi:hypothetical protein